MQEKPKGRPLAAIGVEAKDWHKGLLVKINALHCPSCPRVFIPWLQATKIDGSLQGWYEDERSATTALDAVKGFDVVVRISPGKRGIKRCDDHRLG